MATRAPRRPRPAGARLSEMEAGSPATIYRITEEAEEDAGLLSYLEARALTPGAPVTAPARPASLDSLTLAGPRGGPPPGAHGSVRAGWEGRDSRGRDGPRGRATRGLRPAALIRVLPGEADPAL